jgi:hypothetical protein
MRRALLTWLLVAGASHARPLDKYSVMSDWGLDSMLLDVTAGESGETPYYLTTRCKSLFGTARLFNSFVAFDGLTFNYAKARCRFSSSNFLDIHTHFDI